MNPSKNPSKNPPRNVDPFEELQFALAEGMAQDPPAVLGETMLSAALSARPAGRPVDEPPAITPAEGFRRATRSLDAVLSALSVNEWHRPAIRDLDVQGLVGHLMAVERDFQRALSDPEGPQADADHVASTNPSAAEQTGRQPWETYRLWRATLADTLAALDELESDPGRLEGEAALYGLRIAVAPLLIVRTFELWTHEENVRRATTRPLAAPDASTLALMTALGVALLPSALARVRPDGAQRTARIVLTGPGGGTWRTSLSRSAPDGTEGGAGGASPATDGSNRSNGSYESNGSNGSNGSAPIDVRIVVDAVDFCRLLANRIDPAALDAVVSGDGALAEDVFAGAISLALD